MKDRPVQPDQASSNRIGAQRRAARAQVAGYIHELSTRHGASSGVAPARDRASRVRGRHAG
jgi:hypothetical protein